MKNNRKLAVKIIRESLIEYIKENLKAFLGFVFISLIGIVPSFIDSINSIVIKLPLSVFFLAVAVVLIITLLLFIVISRNRNLIKEIEIMKNPVNNNVNKFMQGDIVIRRVNKDAFNPTRLTVSKITKSEIICRTSNDSLVSYSPEELLTSQESAEVFMKEEFEAQRQQIENERFFNDINSWNR